MGSHYVCGNLLHNMESKPTFYDPGLKVTVQSLLCFIWVPASHKPTWIQILGLEVLMRPNLENIPCSTCTIELSFMAHGLKL